MDDIHATKDLSKLPLHERIAATLLMITVILFTAVNLYLDIGEMPEAEEDVRHLVPPFIEVSISGAVARPGTYQVLKGSTVGEVLKLAEPLVTANLKNIKKDSKIVRRRKIVVRNHRA